MTTDKQEVKIPSSEEILNPASEQTQEAPKQEVKEYSDAEKLAMEQGWVPKDQWKGNPDEWRPAKEFNDRGELFNRIKSQSKELSELRQAMAFLTEQQKKQFDAGFQQAIRDLKTARDTALQEGDIVKAQQITDKIDEVKDQHREQKEKFKEPPKSSTVSQEPSTVFRAWFDQNKWYTQDKAMTSYAELAGYEWKQANPDGTEADMLTHVTKVVKKEFPHKFQVRGAPAPDSEGRDSPRGQSESTGKFKDLENGMTDEQRSIMKTILKSTGMTKEQYFKQYAS